MPRKMKHIATIFLLYTFTIIYGVAQTGKIEGRVYDKSNNDPLPFANIIIDGTNIGSVSDLDGNFLFTGVEPGFVKLRASYVGYKPAISDEIQVTNAKTMYIEIPMEPSGQEIEEVVVRASPFRKSEESPVSLQRIGLSDIETNPGSNRDISRVIQSFPGVAFIPTFRNDIIIRGGGPSENVFYLDDVEIPIINHFATQGASGGPVGIINADLLSSVNFYTGAFPANRMNTLSSVIDLNQIEGNKEKPKFRFSVGASEMSFTMDGPAGDKSSYLFSVRRSYLQFLFSVLELPFLPTFTDYQFKWKTRFNDKNELSIISIGAYDQFRLNTGLENPDEEQEFILTSLPVNNQWNYAIGAVYKHYRENSSQTIVVSRNMLDNSAYKFPDNNESLAKSFDYASQEIENKFRFENTTRVGGFKLNFTANLDYLKYNNQTSQQALINDQLELIEYASDLDVWRWGLSFQASRAFIDDRLILSAGIRADANNYAASMQNLLQQLSPRVSARFIMLPKVSLNMSLGRYYRMPAYTSMGYMENDEYVNKQNNIRYIESNHAIFGIEYIPRDDMVFTLEGFYKGYDHYPISVKDSVPLSTKGAADFGVIGNEEITSDGEGRAYGFELMNRIKTGNWLNFIFSYTYVRSEFIGNNEEWAPSSWDSRHIISSTATVNFGKNWSAGAKWRFSGGLPYSPYDLEYSSIKDAWDINGGPYTDYSQVNSIRFSSFNQLDIRVDKRYFFPKWSLMLYLDIQNLFNQKAEQRPYVVREKDANGDYILVDNDTKYVLKTIDSTTGTVLPTIGVMVEF